MDFREKNSNAILQGPFRELSDVDDINVISVNKKRKASMWIDVDVVVADVICCTVF